MGALARKLSRFGDMRRMLREHAADARTARRLVGCYLKTLTSVTSRDRVELALSVEGATLPFRMRKSDLFVLEEVLRARVYELETALPERPIVVDAGANIGVSALWLHARYRPSVLACFEPEPENFELLAANVGALEGVLLERAALGAADGTATLHLSPHGATHSLVEAGGGGAVPVGVRALAGWLEGRGIERVDLLKLDVEGSELELLRGLGDALDRVGVVCGELHTRVVHEGDFYAHLERHGLGLVWRRELPGDAEEGVHMFEAAR